MANTPQEALAQRALTRNTRKPFGSHRQKLAYEPRAGYHRHWFNAEPGRIDDALQAGYTHVEDKEGRKVSRVVGNNAAGGALDAFLMEIPEEWYNEDMARQQVAVDELDGSIRRGEVSGGLNENRYVPEDRGIKIEDRTGKNR